MQQSIVSDRVLDGSLHLPPAALPFPRSPVLQVVRSLFLLVLQCQFLSFEDRYPHKLQAWPDVVDPPGPRKGAFLVSVHKCFTASLHHDSSALVGFAELLTACEHSFSHT